jgi:hypothetical protein
MKRIDDDTIALTMDELYDIREFIRSALAYEWDHYTNNVICHDTKEDGMRRMNPDMYDVANKIQQFKEN